MEHTNGTAGGTPITIDMTTVPADVAACGLALGLVCVTSALFGNGLIIATISREPSLRQRQNVFLVSSAMSEIVLVFLHNVFWLAVYALGRLKFYFKILFVRIFNLLQ